MKVLLCQKNEMTSKIIILQIRCIVFILATLIILIPQSKAQDIAYIIHKEEKDGLADRKVDHIMRDVDGYFYVTTSQSIQQYDGEKFEIVSEVPTSFDSDQIQFIHNDSIVGSSIIAENNPVNSFTLCTNQLNPISIRSQITESVSSSDSVFLAGNSKQLFYLSKVGPSRYKIYGKSGYLKEIRFTTLPSKLFYDQSSSIFFAEWKDKSIQLIDKGSSKDYSGKIVWYNNQVTICNANGIYRWTSKGFETIHELKTTSDDILWAKADKKGNVLIALHIHVAKVDNLLLLKSSGELVTYNNILAINDNIRDVYAEDFEDKLMLATFNGLFAVNLVTRGIKRIWYTKSLAKSSFGAVISGIASDDKDVYFCKEGGGLYKLKNEEYLNLIPTKKLPNINGIVYYKAGEKLVISSYTFSGTGYLHIFDIATQNLQQIPLDFTPLQIAWDSESVLCVSGKAKKQQFRNDDVRGKLITYNLVNNQITEINLPTEIGKKSIRAVHYDKETNTRLIGTTNGFYSVEPGSTKQLNSAHIRMIRIYDDKMFVGTRNDGLYIYDKDSQELLKHLNSSQELTENSIIAMEQDADNNYWLASFGGITVLNSKLEVTRRIYEDEGLSNGEFNTMASEKFDNQLYFGTINGLTKINPIEVLQRKNEVKLDLTQVDEWQNGKLASKQFSQNLNIQANLDSINFHYAIPDYYPTMHSFRQSDIKYSINKKSAVDYRDRNIHFSDLKLGRHKLELQAGNTSYTLGGNKEINFKVVPYLAPWIVGAIILFLAFLILWAFRKQKKESVASLQQERERFDKQLAEMELVALRAQMNPHFIFNALGAIQYFINTNDVERADEYLSKFAKLMRSILESSKSKFIGLEEEIHMLKLYSSLEHIRFEEKFDYSFEVDENIEGSGFQIPSMIIQPIVENAINHGLYHLDNRMGKLEVTFKMRDEETVICKIKDNGIGRHASANFRKKKAHKSRGMQIIKERISALKKSDLYELEINYDDLKTPTLGTEVTIVIHQNH